MKILVLDSNYPSDTNLYGDVFVHARVQAYVACGHHVEVLSWFTRRESYSFEGVAVTCVSDLPALRAAIDVFAPDVIAIHFFQGWMLRKVVKRTSAPIVIWVHGMEALGWYRRLFDFGVTRDFARYILSNTLQLSRMRQLYRYMRQHRDRVAIVFVSEWMRRIAAIDALSDIRPYHIIPNPIDSTLFRFEPKDGAMRTKVLLIRSFESRKYANDLAIAAIRLLQKRPEFSDFVFTIVGSGRLFRDLTYPLREFANVTLLERFLPRAAIQDLHARHGVFLCPTRQDAQGVSMCEAMSSGLIPIASPCTAIPEFVTNGESGYLCGSPKAMVSAFLELWRSPERFQRMSAAASRAINIKAAYSVVIPQELELMQQLVRG